METGKPIHVRVNDEFVLDAGTLEAVVGPHGRERRIHPPESTMFHQVLAYLREKPTPLERWNGSAAEIDGLAATAVALRWGSYFAVLADHDKPIAPVAAQASGESRINDHEMARINIEASAALAAWIDIFRANDGGREYHELAHRAVAYLPMPCRATTVKPNPLMHLADSEMSSQWIEVTPPEHLAEVRADAERYPTRLFANALVNFAWRNGPIEEEVHGGRAWNLPLDQRRVTLQEEAELMHFTSSRLVLGLMVCRYFQVEQSQRSWSEQVVPFGLAQAVGVTPTGWTLTETSREVRLQTSGTDGQPST